MQLKVIQSLCEIEFELSRVSAQLTERLAAERGQERAGMRPGSHVGSVPSGMHSQGFAWNTARASPASLLHDSCNNPMAARGRPTSFPDGGGDEGSFGKRSGSGFMEQRLQSTSSFASLLSLGAV